MDPDADFLYIVTNNTIFGTLHVPAHPPTGVPLVADASSNILSQNDMDVGSSASSVFARRRTSARQACAWSSSART